MRVIKKATLPWTQTYLAEHTGLGRAFLSNLTPPSSPKSHVGLPPVVKSIFLPPQMAVLYQVLRSCGRTNLLVGWLKASASV